MRIRNLLPVVAAATAVPFAAAQSATLALEAPATSVAPGGSVTVTATVTFDTGSASPGVFGSAGLYGFGGDVSASGSASGNVAGSTPAVSGQFTFGTVANVSAAPGVVRAAAGRGLAGGLSGGQTAVFSFDLAADVAASGEVTLDYAGAVVLVLDDSLVTFSTNPGPNQSSLTVTPLTLTVGSAGCSDADTVEPFGTLDIDDVLAFLNGFATQDPVADIAPPTGVFDIDDVLAFLNAFAAGCP